MVSNWKSIFVLVDLWITVELEMQFGRKYEGWWGAVFLLKLRFAIITMNGVELGKHFCSR